MRFSVSKSGLFWTFFEPFFQVIFFILLKTLILGNSTENFDYAVFLALSFTAFFMFKNIVIKTMGAFSANKGLFVYKQVKPIDTIIARVMVEIFISTIVIFIFILIGFYFNFDMNIKNLPMVVIGYIFLLIFSISFGLFSAILITLFASAKNVINIILRPLLFISALFHTIEMVPSQVQNILLYNPLVHFMEMIHGYYFHVLNDKFVNYNYILLWTIILLYFGLWFYQKLEERIISK